MKIQAVTKYIFKGKEYNSLKEVQDAVHNIIGEEVLDKFNRVVPNLSTKDFLAMLDVLCKKEVREVLIESYSVNYETTEYWSDGEYTTETHNILDYKLKK